MVVAEQELANIENLLSFELKQYESFFERLAKKGQPALIFYDVIKKTISPYLVKNKNLILFQQMLS